MPLWRWIPAGVGLLLATLSTPTAAAQELRQQAQTAPQQQGPVQAAPERPRDRPPAREWFVIEEHGRRRERGVIHRRELPATRSQPSRLETVEEREGRREREGLLFETRVQIKTVTESSRTASGRAFRRETIETAGDRKTVTTVTVDSRRGEVRLDRNPPPAGQPRQLRFPAPSDLRFSLEPGTLIALAGGAARLVPGTRIRSPVLEETAGRVAEEVVEIVAVGPVAQLAAPLPSVFAPDFLSPDTVLIDALSHVDGRDPVRLVFTPGGRLLWMGRPDGVVAWRATDQAEYERESAPVAIVTTLLHGGRLTAWQAYDRLDFELSPADAWQAVLPPEDFDAPRAAWRPLPENRLHLTLFGTGVGAAPVTPPSPPPPGIWLRGIDHPEMTRAAREADAFRSPTAPTVTAATPEKMARARLRRLTEWVGREIRSRQQVVIVLDPLETLRQRRGHCGEHARLLVALCRTLGMPARVCQGLTVRETGLVYHAWVEAWTGDGWTSADSTIGLVDFRAGYWATARETPDGGMADPLAGALQRGGLRVRWLGASVVDPDGRWHGWRMDDPLPPPLARRGEGTFDFIMGVGLWTPPPGWRFAGRDDGDGGLVWEAPDGATALRLQAWPGTFRVDETAWRRRSGALQANLPRYRLDAGLVGRWPPEEAIVMAPAGFDAIPPRVGFRLDYRWRGEKGLRWARQWEVALPERIARATVMGEGDSRFHDPLTQLLFAASRLY